MLNRKAQAHLAPLDGNVDEEVTEIEGGAEEGLSLASSEVKEILSLTSGEQEKQLAHLRSAGKKEALAGGERRRKHRRIGRSTEVNKNLRRSSKSACSQASKRSSTAYSLLQRRAPQSSGSCLDALVTLRRACVRDSSMLYPLLVRPCRGVRGSPVKANDVLVL